MKNEKNCRMKLLGVPMILLFFLIGSSFQTLGEEQRDFTQDEMDQIIRKIAEDNPSKTAYIGNYDTKGEKREFLNQKDFDNQVTTDVETTLNNYLILAEFSEGKLNNPYKRGNCAFTIQTLSLVSCLSGSTHLGFGDPTNHMKNLENEKVISCAFQPGTKPQPYPKEIADGLSSKNTESLKTKCKKRNQWMFDQCKKHTDNIANYLINLETDPKVQTLFQRVVHAEAPACTFITLEEVADCQKKIDEEIPSGNIFAGLDKISPEMIQKFKKTVPNRLEALKNFEKENKQEPTRRSVEVKTRESGVKSGPMIYIVPGEVNYHSSCWNDNQLKSLYERDIEAFRKIEDPIRLREFLKKSPELAPILSENQAKGLGLAFPGDPVIKNAIGTPLYGREVLNSYLEGERKANGESTYDPASRTEATPTDSSLQKKLGETVAEEANSGTETPASQPESSQDLRIQAETAVDADYYENREKKYREAKEKIEAERKTNEYFLEQKEKGYDTGAMPDSFYEKQLEELEKEHLGIVRQVTLPDAKPAQAEEIYLYTKPADKDLGIIREVTLPDAKPAMDTDLGIVRQVTIPDAKPAAETTQYTLPETSPDEWTDKRPWYQRLFGGSKPAEKPAEESEFDRETGRIQGELVDDYKVYAGNEIKKNSWSLLNIFGFGRNKPEPQQEEKKSSWRIDTSGLEDPSYAKPLAYSKPVVVPRLTIGKVLNDYGGELIKRYGTEKAAGKTSLNIKLEPGMKLTTARKAQIELRDDRKDKYTGNIQTIQNLRKCRGAQVNVGKIPIAKGQSLNGISNSFSGGAVVSTVNNPFGIECTEDNYIATMGRGTRSELLLSNSGQEDIIIGTDFGPQWTIMSPGSTARLNNLNEIGMKTGKSAVKIGGIGTAVGSNDLTAKENGIIEGRTRVTNDISQGTKIYDALTLTSLSYPYNYQPKNIVNGITGRKILNGKVLPQTLNKELKVRTTYANGELREPASKEIVVSDLGKGVIRVTPNIKTGDNVGIEMWGADGRAMAKIDDKNTFRGVATFDKAVLPLTYYLMSKDGNRNNMYTATAGSVSVFSDKGLKVIQTNSLGELNKAQKRIVGA